MDVFILVLPLLIIWGSALIAAYYLFHWGGSLWANASTVPSAFFSIGYYIVAGFCYLFSVSALAWAGIFSIFFIAGIQGAPR